MILRGTNRFRRSNFSHAKKALAQLGVSSFVEQQKKFRRKWEIVVESPWGKFNWSVLSLPFLWPLLKSAREKSEDVMRNGVKRLKKMDVEKYATPIRKRWRAWTR